MAGFFVLLNASFCAANVALYVSAGKPWSLAAAVLGAAMTVFSLVWYAKT